MEVARPVELTCLQTSKYFQRIRVTFWTLFIGQLRDLVDVATDRELHEQISAMTENLQLNLGKNYLTYQAKDGERLLHQFMSSIGDIKDLCMLPSKISIEASEAVACLETKITMTVSRSRKAMC